MSDERVPSIDEAASMANNIVKALIEGLVRTSRQVTKAVRKLVEAFDPKRLRRRRRALVRSRRNNQYLKSIGRCR